MAQTLRERRNCFYEHCWNPPREIPMCANCEHFHKHYIKDGNAFRQLSSGHCVYPRMKGRDIFDLCEHFEAKRKIITRLPAGRKEEMTNEI